jgi:hypothetical protein
MNTIDAKPQTSLGDRVTLVRRSYPEVNALIRTNPKCQKTFVDVIYGKQNLIDADPPLPAAKTPAAERCERRIGSRDDQSPAAAEYPRAASSTGRRR